MELMCVHSTSIKCLKSSITYRGHIILFTCSLLLSCGWEMIIILFYFICAFIYYDFTFPPAPSPQSLSFTLKNNFTIQIYSLLIESRKVKSIGVQNTIAAVRPLLFPIFFNAHTDVPQL